VNIRAGVAAIIMVVTTSAAAVAAPPEAIDGPPSDPACLPLASGTTGVLAVGGQLPTPSQLLGGNGLGAPTTIALPRRVWFRDGADASSASYDFAARDGKLYARPLGEAGWRTVLLPVCLEGRVAQVSADRTLLLVTTTDGQVYSHDMPGGDLSPERWTWRWGPYLWTGSGVRLPSDTMTWAASTFDSNETFTDTAGRPQHPLGVATVYLLRAGGRHLTYLDPWLPADLSREVCLPQHGRDRLASIAGSGSTVFAMTRRAQLFTRLYDFDISGANTVLGSYSWEQHPTGTTWHLPGPRWRAHTAPPGTYTDRIAIAHTGTNAADRELRVEGARHGRTGVWVSPISSPHWAFVPTGSPLVGDTVPMPTRPVHRMHRSYRGVIGGAAVRVDGFNWACSPSRMTVRFAPKVSLTLRLHSYDGLRQGLSRPGLTDTPRHYLGAIQIPRHTWGRLAHLDPRIRAWVAANLDGRFTTSPLDLTLTRLRFTSQCWQLTYLGRAPRPDAVAPPDPGVTVGILTEANQNGSNPGIC
jgi:hypothetical protein